MDAAIAVSDVRLRDLPDL